MERDSEGKLSDVQSEADNDYDDDPDTLKMRENLELIKEDMLHAQTKNLKKKKVKTADDEGFQVHNFQTKFVEDEEAFSKQLDDATQLTVETTAKKKLNERVKKDVLKQLDEGTYFKDEAKNTKLTQELGQRESHIQDHCPVCLDIAAEPVKYSCGHFICIQCEKTLSAYDYGYCVICRAKLDRPKQPIIDQKLQEEIKESDPQAYEQQQLQLQEAGAWHGSKQLLLSFGTNSLPNDRQNYDQDQNCMCRHQFAIFLTINNNATNTKKCISHVTYKLSEEFKEEPITVQEHPFRLLRYASHDFIIQCSIIFQTWTLMSPITIDHLVQFQKKEEVVSDDPRQQLVLTNHYSQNLYDLDDGWWGRIGRRLDQEQQIQYKSIRYNLEKIKIQCQKEIKRWEKDQSKQGQHYQVNRVSKRPRKPQKGRDSDSSEDLKKKQRSQSSHDASNHSEYDKAVEASKQLEFQVKKRQRSLSQIEPESLEQLSIQEEEKKDFFGADRQSDDSGMQIDTTQQAFDMKGHQSAPPGINQQQSMMPSFDPFHEPGQIQRGMSGLQDTGLSGFSMDEEDIGLSQREYLAKQVRVNRQNQQQLLMEQHKDMGALAKALESKSFFETGKFINFQQPQAFSSSFNFGAPQPMIHSFGDEDKATDSMRKNTTYMQPQQPMGPDGMHNPNIKKIVDWAISREKKIKKDSQDYDRLKKKESELIMSLIRGIPKDGFSGAAKKQLTKQRALSKASSSEISDAVDRLQSGKLATRTEVGSDGIHQEKIIEEEDEDGEGDDDDKKKLRNKLKDGKRSESSSEIEDEEINDSDSSNDLDSLDKQDLEGQIETLKQELELAKLKKRKLEESVEQEVQRRTELQVEKRMIHLNEKLKLTRRAAITNAMELFNKHGTQLVQKFTVEQQHLINEMLKKDTENFNLRKLIKKLRTMLEHQQFCALSQANVLEAQFHIASLTTEVEIHYELEQMREDQEEKLRNLKGKKPEETKDNQVENPEQEEEDDPDKILQAPLPLCLYDCLTVLPMHQNRKIDRSAKRYVIPRLTFEHDLESGCRRYDFNRNEFSEWDGPKWRARSHWFHDELNNITKILTIEIHAQSKQAELHKAEKRKLKDYVKELEDKISDCNKKDKELLKQLKTAWVNINYIEKRTKDPLLAEIKVLKALNNSMTTNDVQLRDKMNICSKILTTPRLYSQYRKAVLRNEQKSNLKELQEWQRQNSPEKQSPGKYHKSESPTKGDKIKLYFDNVHRIVSLGPKQNETYDENVWKQLPEIENILKRSEKGTVTTESRNLVQKLKTLPLTDLTSSEDGLSCHPVFLQTESPPKQHLRDLHSSFINFTPERGMCNTVMTDTIMTDTDNELDQISPRINIKFDSSKASNYLRSPRTTESQNAARHQPIKARQIKLPITVPTRTVQQSQNNSILKFRRVAKLTATPKDKDFPQDTFSPKVRSSYANKSTTDTQSKQSNNQLGSHFLLSPKRNMITIVDHTLDKNITLDDLNRQQLSKSTYNIQAPTSPVAQKRLKMNVATNRSQLLGRAKNLTDKKGHQTEAEFNKNTLNTNPMFLVSSSVMKMESYENNKKSSGVIVFKPQQTQRVLSPDLISQYRKSTSPTEIMALQKKFGRRFLDRTMPDPKKSAQSAKKEMGQHLLEKEETYFI